MLVSERERTACGAEYDYASLRNDRYGRFDYERSYEEDRNRTSPSYRDSLMNSLERPATRSRLERADDDRYGFYMANISAGENNYDRFWDEKHRAEQKEAAVNPKRRFAFMMTYIVVAVVALIAVTLSVVGLGDKKTTVVKTIETEKAIASAEVQTEGAPVGIVASEGEVTAPVAGGENYIMLKNGELVAIEAPQRAAETKEEEKGFDGFCTWLNEVFGG